MLYDLAFLLFSIFYLPALIFKGKMHGGFAERFGLYNKSKREALAHTKSAIWIQAVSVGEVAICKSLIPLLNKRFPGSEIVLSTITRAGNDLAKKLYPDAIVIYFPLDFSFIVRQAVNLIRPKVYIMIETEIWPNVLKEMASRRVPSVLINGRISDRSFSRYKMARPFLKKPLNGINAFCMQSEVDAERILQLGAPSGRVKVTGNMKFDIDADVDIGSAQAMKRYLGLKAEEDLIVAGSTHPGEEYAVIEAFRDIGKDFPRTRLLIAPRHIEKSGKVGEAVEGFGFEPVMVSGLGKRPSPVSRRSILILDEIGRLKDAYAVASIVFVGGSLVKHGGQNPLEPAMFEKPIIFGPHMFNFRFIRNALLDKGGAVEVSDRRELCQKMRFLLNDKEARAALGKRAREVVMENRGATEANVNIIMQLAA